MHLLLYEYVPDILERRGPHREAHLALISRLKGEGVLEDAGALGDPPTGAAFVLSDIAAAERLLAEDPYVRAGLVSGHSARRWNLVTG